MRPDYAGWYEYDASRTEVTRFLDRLAVLAWLRFKDGKLSLNYLGGWNDTLIPGSQARNSDMYRGKRRAAGSSCDDRTADSK